MHLTPSQLKRVRAAGEGASRIKAARAAIGWTQVKLAGALGITQSYLSDVERGRYAEHSLDTARMFAEFFGCQIEDLFPSKTAVAS